MRGGRLSDPPLEPPACPRGWETGPPEFVGVGAQRSGTTWWFGQIRSHPRVESPPGGKELQYFNRYWQQPPPPELALHYAEQFPRPKGKISGEWTPRYMSDLSSIRLLKHAAPEARILVLLRDPVERYRSALSRFRRLASARDRRRYAPDYSDAVWQGMYASQIENLFRHYPPKRVLVLQYERCVRDPVAELARTFRFLGLEPTPSPRPRWFRRSPPQARLSSHAPLEPGVYDDLLARYEPEVERLVELCPEIDVSLWPNFSGLIGR